MGKELKYFSKENVQMTNKHMKRQAASRGTRGIQIKTTVRFHFTSTRMVVIKKKGARK